MRTIILFLLFGITTAFADTPAPKKHTFAIYLAPRVDYIVLAGMRPNDLMGHTLEDSPIITDEDILSYDFERHAMTLKPEALARLPRPKVSGNGFVVMADGQRIYLGAFTTCVSSMSFAVPSIMVDGRALNTNQPPNVLVIDRAYPDTLSCKGPDPRSDPRIKEALTGLHKLPADRSGFDRGLTKQISDILLECQGIRKGTTRLELSNVFTTEGGLSTARKRTYVHRHCPYIKVDVEFEPSRPGQGVVDEQPTDVIARVSRPYLQFSIMD